MKWTTISPYTHTTINSLFVKRQTNSRVTCKDLYGKNLIRTNHVISCVQEPLNEPPEIHDSQKRESKLWLTDGEKNGANLLRESMNTLAREQMCFNDYERGEYDSYSLVLYKLLLDDLKHQRRELQYSNIFGDKWRKTPTNKSNLLNIHRRIYEVEKSCKDFIKKERAFKKKYFQDENYIIKGIDVE